MRFRNHFKLLLALPFLTLGFAVPLSVHAADNAAFVSQSVPSSLNAGQVATVSVTMQNNGTTPWTEAGGFKLGTQNPQDNTLWTGFTRVYLNPGETVAVGASRAFTFNITAPGTPGTYNFQWRMVHEGIAWFGAFSPNVAISVVAAPADASAFVSQSVPTSLAVGQTASVSVTMKNTGTATWSEAGLYRLGSQNPQDNFTWGTNRVLITGGQTVPPNGNRTFTFNVTAPATAGTYNFQWRMVHDNVAWFGAFSPNVAIQVVAAAVTLCPGVVVTPGGTTDLSSQLQTCIDNTPNGGTFNIPAGTYGLANRVLINRPMTVRTQGTAGVSGNCEAAGVTCAVLKALPTFNANVRGFLAVESTTDVTIDHLILDGNRAARLGTAAANGCAGGTNGWGFNAHMHSCNFCRFTNNVNRNTLCGTALEFIGDDAIITNNVIRGNGQNSVTNMWSDGITALAANRATISGNTFVDNSDVALILGGGTNAMVSGNSITQPGQVVFAGLMLDNFNGGTTGNFTGAQVINNTIDCSAARNCHFGINLGPHPWYLSANIFGGDVHGNSVTSARQGINVDGAGTAAAPLLLYGNTATNPAPSPGSFLGCTHATSAININTGDSVVNRNGDPAPITTNVWHLCV